MQKYDHVGIGEVSKTMGFTLRTLRFYEQRGLVKPLRSKGLRYYSPTDIERLKEVQRLTRYGFTLTEIKAGVSQRQLILQHAELVLKIEDLSKAAVELQREIEDGSGDVMRELVRRG